MRRLFSAALVAVFVLLVAPMHSYAQSPAPETTEATSDDDDGRPWGRLAIFIPVSLALGAGAVYGRRLARDRGWGGN